MRLVNFLALLIQRAPSTKFLRFQFSFDLTRSILPCLRLTFHDRKLNLLALPLAPEFER